MIYFLDTEFTNLPWISRPQLISIGLVKENGESYYACLNDFSLERASDFVREKVLPSLECVAVRKSSHDVAQEILNFVNEYSPTKIYCVFPTENDLIRMSVPKDIQGILTKYEDLDFQLFRNLFANNYPEKWVSIASSLNPIVQILKDNKRLPKNNDAHNSLSDALWNRRVWIKAGDIKK